MNLSKKANCAIGFLLSIFVVSCTSFPSVSPTVEANPYWVIITRKQADEMGIASWLVESDGFWTPSSDDILTLEEELVDYLRQNSSYFFQQPPAWERLDEYQRQYIGLQRGGKQTIYGNFFCDNSGIDWWQTLVIVEDGGDCYFQVEFDVEDGAFIMLLVN